MQEILIASKQLNYRKSVQSVRTASKHHIWSKSIFPASQIFGKLIDSQFQKATWAFVDCLDFSVPTFFLQFLPNSSFTVIRFIGYLLFCLLSLALSNVLPILVCLFSCSFSLSHLFLFNLIPFLFRITAYSIIFSSVYFVSLPRCPYLRSEKLYLSLLILFVVCIFLTDSIFTRFYVSFIIYQPPFWLQLGWHQPFGYLKEKNPFGDKDK